MKKWVVYEHISPSGKVYVGITCQKPEKRWKGGSGYVRKDNHQPLFANAILKYGWNNIEHRIIADNLTREEANAIEQSLISKYKREKRSYNITDGGDGGHGIKHTAKTREYLSRIHTGKKEPKEMTILRINNRIEKYPYFVVAIKPGNIQVFKTAKEAASTLGITNRCNISASLAGKQCLVKGFVFVHWDKNIPLDKNALFKIYNEKVNNRYKSERKISHDC